MLGSTAPAAALALHAWLVRSYQPQLLSTSVSTVHPCTHPAPDLPAQLALPQRLVNRLQRNVADFDAAMSSLRTAYGAAPYTPSYGPLEELDEGVVYLEHIDEHFRRYYARR